MYQKIKASSNVTRKFNAVRVVMLIVGFIPFFVNLCRLGAAVYQIFIFRKYNTGCLRYVFDHQTNMTTISQVTFWSFTVILRFKLAPVGRLWVLGVGRVSVFHTQFHRSCSSLYTIMLYWSWKARLFDRLNYFL